MTELTEQMAILKRTSFYESLGLNEDTIEAINESYSDTQKKTYNSAHEMISSILAWRFSVL